MGKGKINQGKEIKFDERIANQVQALAQKNEKKKQIMEYIKIYTYDTFNKLYGEYYAQGKRVKRIKLKDKATDIALNDKHPAQAIMLKFLLKNEAGYSENINLKSENKNHNKNEHSFNDETLKNIQDYLNAKKNNE